jgi:hypothetical protein
MAFGWPIVDTKKWQLSVVRSARVWETRILWFWHLPRTFRSLRATFRTFFQPYSRYCASRCFSLVRYCVKLLTYLSWVRYNLISAVAIFRFYSSHSKTNLKLTMQWSRCVNWEGWNFSTLSKFLVFSLKMLFRAFVEEIENVVKLPPPGFWKWCLAPIHLCGLTTL